MSGVYLGHAGTLGTQSQKAYRGIRAFGGS